MGTTDLDPTLDDGDDPLVLGAVDDHHGRVGVVALDELVDLSGNLAVATHALARARHDRHDGLVAVCLQVPREPERLEKAVDPTVFRVVHAHAGDERLHGIPTHDGQGLVAEGFTAVETDDQGGHGRTQWPTG